MESKFFISNFPVEKFCIIKVFSVLILGNCKLQLVIVEGSYNV